jgi:Protein of unknown function (DUF2934)
MTTDFEQKIRERAYQIWEQEGRIEGRAEQHWHMARFELTSAADFAADAPVAAEPAKKSRRAKTPLAAAPVPTATPRRRRAPATLQ